jgi:hypothetical protein
LFVCSFVRPTLGDEWAQMGLGFSFDGPPCLPPPLEDGLGRRWMALVAKSGSTPFLSCFHPWRKGGFGAGRLSWPIRFDAGSFFCFLFWCLPPRCHSRRARCVVRCNGWLVVVVAVPRGTASAASMSRVPARLRCRARRRASDGVADEADVGPNVNRRQLFRTAGQGQCCAEASTPPSPARRRRAGYSSTILKSDNHR